MLEHVESIGIPYVSSTREALDLPEDQPALAIFAAHHCQSVLNMHKTNNIHQKICEGLSAIQIMVKGAVEEKVPEYSYLSEKVRPICAMCLQEKGVPQPAHYSIMFFPFRYSGVIYSLPWINICKIMPSFYVQLDDYTVDLHISINNVFNERTFPMH